ncbi:MAG: M20/M25/M40 family metallo-hydrolase [Bacteroidetes bacterium]|uniref:M20/M25/M40 family metallo-hydrolase n=1 Tax=Candidatus Cryptobacteroides avicola TaxID=2840757 RepID=A0A940DQI0_9BACT|nr:M20/M25/M40 family metallo-hydrolase [Candidatus Cryptobacteroides avicola]
MKKIGLLIILLGLCTAVRAESPEKKGLETINRENAEAYIGFLASDALRGREAGTQWGKIAGEYIVSNLKTLGVKPLYDSYYQPFEAYSKERQKKGRWQVHPDSIALLKQEVHRKLEMNNILCKIDGKNPDEFVVVGAHYDHLGFDPALEGDNIYNGADDNASGVSAVLQLVKAFLATGVRPERTVIFAFWDGEEKGLLGSEYFVQTFPGISEVKGYLNYDMIGRNADESNPGYLMYFYTEAHPVFGDWLKDSVEKYGLDLAPDYRAWDRPVGGSDNASFALRDVPVIWYHTAGHPDYHMPGDHTDRINWNKIVDITKASFISAWNLANEKEY